MKITFNNKKKSLYFSKNQYREIMFALQTGDLKWIDLYTEGESETLKMEISYNLYTGKALIQLYKFIPFDYIKCSKVYEFSTNKIRPLISMKSQH